MPHCLCAFQIAAMSVSCPVFRLLSVRLSRFSPLATFLLACPFPVRSSDAIPILFIQPGSAPLGFPRSVRRSMFIGAPCSLSRRVSLPAAFPLALAPLSRRRSSVFPVDGCIVHLSVFPVIFDLRRFLLKISQIHGFFFLSQNHDFSFWYKDKFIIGVSCLKSFFSVFLSFSPVFSCFHKKSNNS